VRASNLAALFAAALSVLATGEAAAVPSFADQTGQPCTACHIGGFGPELTPFGRSFKLGGYTNRVSDSAIPLSAHAIASFVHTAADQADPPAPHYATNGNVTLDEASLFLAGGLGNHFGGFMQATYEGVGRSFAWDHVDLRAVTDTRIGMTSAVIGLSLNNTPGVEDPWNALPSWSFPFTGSDLAPSPEEGTLLAEALGGNVIGLSAYAWWNSSLYTSVGLYRSFGPRFLRAAGIDPADTSIINGVAPYVRAAYQWDMDDRNFEVGAFGLFTDLYPGRDKSAGTTDNYRDLGFDASFQYTGTGENIFAADLIYTHENQDLAASQILGEALNAHGRFEDFRARASYYWKNLLGGSIGYFQTWGASDALRYGENRTNVPDSAGLILQADITPFANDPSPAGTRLNLRVGLQYTIYTQFDGAGRDYDGTGRNASDNNTFRLFTWFAF
jgi:hypothetical protein